MNKLFYIFLLLIFFLSGCGRDVPLVQTKKDLEKYIKPNKKIILFAQGCDINKYKAKNQAQKNFSLNIISNINSKFERNINIDNHIIKKSMENYSFIESTKYNTIIGAKYYYESLFKKNNKNVFCVDIYYDYDYFASFETFFKNKVFELQYIIKNMNSNNYLQQHTKYLKIKKDLLFYTNFYLQWTKKYGVKPKIKLQILNKIDKQLYDKIIKIQNEIIDNKIIELKNIIEIINMQNYKKQQQVYINKKKELLLFLNKTNNSIPKIINLLDKNLYQKIKIIKQKIFNSQKKQLNFYIKKFKMILNDNIIVESQNKRKKIISKLLNIKNKAINIIKQYPKQFKKENKYFDKYTKSNLYSKIKVKPICSFTFESNKFLQNKYYKILDNSFDVDGKSVNVSLYIENGVKAVVNQDYGWDFTSKESGYKSFKLIVKSQNGLQSSCEKKIYIQPYDIRLEYFYIDMDISKFKNYVKNKFNGIKKEYPNSFFKSLLDSRKVYFFDKYYAFFVKDKLKCLINAKYFNQNRLSCKYYKQKIKIKNK